MVAVLFSYQGVHYAIRRKIQRLWTQLVFHGSTNRERVTSTENRISPFHCSSIESKHADAAVCEYMFFVYLQVRRGMEGYILDAKKINDDKREDVV